MSPEWIDGYWTGVLVGAPSGFLFAVALYCIWRGLGHFREWRRLTRST